jgi:peptidoglycan hydrolase-like protein with peptidoglycan-binding domain
MGVLTARLVFLAFIGLTASIIYNALYLQGQHGVAIVAGALPPRHVVTVPIGPAPVESSKLPPVSTDLPPLDVEQGSPELLLRAVQRELAARGFDVGPANGKPNAKTRAAISDYQKSQGLPVTGAASDDLLRHILLGASLQPSVATGSVAPAENAAKSKQTPAEGAKSKQMSSDGAKPKLETTVKSVQQILADLGYAPGPVDGAMGDATTRAIKAFQRDRKIAETGRITPDLMREFKRVTGRDLTKTAAGR